MQEGFSVNESRDLIRQPLTDEEIRRLAGLAAGIRQILSTKSPKYGQYRDRVHSDDEWVHWMSREPRLIKRPLLEHQGKLAVGFNPDQWSDLLSQRSSG